MHLLRVVQREDDRNVGHCLFGQMREDSALVFIEQLSFIYKHVIKTLRPSINSPLLGAQCPKHCESDVIGIQNFKSLNDRLVNREDGVDKLPLFSRHHSMKWTKRLTCRDIRLLVCHKIARLYGDTDVRPQELEKFLARVAVGR